MSNNFLYIFLKIKRGKRKKCRISRGSHVRAPTISQKNKEKGKKSKATAHPIPRVFCFPLLLRPPLLTRGRLLSNL